MRAGPRVLVAARLFALFVVLLFASRAGASASGVDAYNYWQNDDSNGACNKSGCHNVSTSPTTTSAYYYGGVLTSTLNVSPGGTYDITFRITNSAAVRAGFNVRVSSTSSALS